MLQVYKSTKKTCNKILIAGYYHNKFPPHTLKSTLTKQLTQHMKTLQFRHIRYMNAIVMQYNI